MTSPICILRSLLDLPKAFLLDRPRISGHSYVEQDPEPDQACCVQVLKCKTCGDIDVGWRPCTCRIRANK